MKKLLQRFLAIALVLNIVTVPSFSGFFASALDSVSVIYINKNYLKSGNSLEIYNPSGYLLSYFVDDEKIEDEEFILKPDYYEKWVTVKAYENDEFVCEDRAYFSKLPVIYINTVDEKQITSKEEYIDAGMHIQNNTETDEAVYSGGIRIKGRGNSSWKWDKKPYRIKLNEKTNLFGMGKNKNWVLLANYLDESLLRNTTAFQISEELGLITMQTVWTDVILNGEYIGNYQLCEQVRIDKDRVDIFDWEEEAEDIASAVYKAEKKAGNTLNKDALEDTLKSDLSWVTTDEFVCDKKTYKVSDYYDANDNISGGYLFELSNEYDEVSKFKTTGELKVMLKSPEYLYTNSEMMEYAKELWHDFEDAYCSIDGYTTTKDGKKHYCEIADLDTMVSFWLTLEIVGNDDAMRKSRYAYKDIDGLIKFGPVWDFDWGCGSLTVGASATGWKISTNTNPQAFYKEFLDDPHFVCKATEKYWEIRPFLESLIEDNGVIDNEISYLYESGKADETRWDRSLTWPSKARGFEKDSEMYKTYLKNRIAWLDKQFATDSTLLKSVHVSYSAAPYERDKQTPKISILNAEPDDFTEHAPSEYAIKSNKDLLVSIQPDTPDTVAFVYVNGLKYSEFVPEDGEISFEISKDALTSDLGKKNVIFVILRDLKGKVVSRSFTTVTVNDLASGVQPQFVSESRDYNGKINLEYCVDLSNLTKAEKQSAYMELELNGVTKKCFINEAEKDEIGYKFSFDADLGEICGLVKATLYFGDETVTRTLRICDLNEDDILDVVDVAIMRSYIIGAINLDEAKITVGDINCDSVLDIVDVALMRKTLVG